PLQGEPMRRGLPVALVSIFLVSGALRAQAPPPDEYASGPAGLAYTEACPAPPPPRLWLGGDYLLWWVRKAPLPAPLVTSGPFNPDTFIPGVTPTPAALPSPGTAVLFGGRDLSLGTFSGLRLQGGIDLTGDGTLAVEASGFFLEQRSRGFAVSSNAAGVPFLAIPVIDAATGRETSVATSFANDSANLF